jgi:RsiW-degrading membrane proteinase PrsW (M82 family)
MSVMQNYGVLRVVSENRGSREKIARLGSSMSGNSTDQGQTPPLRIWKRGQALLLQILKRGQALLLWILKRGQVPLLQILGGQALPLRILGGGQALPLQSLGEEIKLRHKYLGLCLPEERLMHVLSQRETTIGRALSSDIILLDPTVSRDHVRLVLGEHGWCVQNMTENNVVRVNSHIVAGGAWSPIQPQDLLVVGDTTLQLVAPLPNAQSLARVDKKSNEDRWSLVGRGQVLFPPILFTFLRLRRHPRRFFLVGGLLSIIVFVAVLLVLGRLSSLSGLARGGTSSLILAWVVPLVPALGINILVNFIDRYKRDPWFLRLAAFLWGAIIAIPPALFIEGFIDGFVTHLWSLDSQLVLHAFLLGLDAGVTEETVKGLGLLLLFFVLRDEFDNVTDGIVYGALIGAGFAMVENVSYFLNNTTDVSALIVGRIVLGWLSHSTYTICFGAALGYIRHTRVRWQQRIVPLLGYLLAVCLHTIFDFVNIFVRDMAPTYGNSPTFTRLAVLAVIGNYIPPFIVQIGILYILIKSLMHEAAIIREFLSSEVASGVITVDEYILLPRSFDRTRVERRVLWRCGIRQWLLTRALYQTAIGLAFCKWHVNMGDKPKQGYLRPEVAYRKRIKRIRQEIAALEAKMTG